MKSLLKKTPLYICLFFLFSIAAAQTVYQEQADDSYSEFFKIPIAMDSASFDSFSLKILPIYPSIKIHQVILDKEFHGDLRFIKENNNYLINYKSSEPISIEKKKVIFYISASSSENINSSRLFTYQEKNFYLEQSPLDLEFISKKSDVKKKVAIKDDHLVFGILMLCLGFVFYTESRKTGFWSKFHKLVPGLLMCYLLPSIFSTLGIISPEISQTYFIASRYLLPASLVLLTLSIDLKAVFNLGWRALVMFLTGTVGIIIGGPLAILIVSTFSPESVGGAGFDAVWRGLATLAGSWIGGGANQAAMLEIYHFNPDKYGGMVLIDIVIANIWMALLLIGIGNRKAIDRWFKADNSAIDELQHRVHAFSEKIKRVPSLKDLMFIFTIAFAAVGIAHFGGDVISTYLNENFESIRNNTSPLSSLGGSFFWMISIATLIGVLLSFTKAKNYEGAGASKVGSVFIYILVATIGMKMDLGKSFENPGLIIVGLIWMAIHAGLLIFVAKLIKAPYFFMAVGSQANVGGAASAPVVAAAFHPSLATVGALLAVFGYVIGTYGAMLCAELMRIASGG